MKKIVVMSGKGGVGKSTVAANLAFTLAAKGFKTGLLDCDIHGPSIPKMLGLENVRGLEAKDEKFKPVEVNGLKVVSMGFLLPSPDTPVIWRGPVKHGFIKQVLEQVDWGDLDYLVIDLPPGTGDEVISIVQLAKPDGAVVVTTPQDVALEDVRKAVNFALHVGLPVVGIVENMSGLICPHCSKRIDVFGAGGGKKLAEEMLVPFVGQIPLDPEIVKSGDEGKPFVQMGTKTAEIFSEIVDKILSNIPEKKEEEKGEEEGKKEESSGEE
jgi:Mrp family chromosome partitioning ATPase